MEMCDGHLRRIFSFISCWTHLWHFGSLSLNLALDIKDMRLAKDDFDTKKSIYENGKNSPNRSLKQLSTNAENQFGNSPYYNIYKAGFELLGTEEERDTTGLFDGESVEVYANTVVNDLFQLDVTHIEAEAALVMNVAMAFLGSLWKMLDACNVNDVEKATLALDEAAAYWVGAEQVKGDAQTGFFFYSAAQFVGAKFNQVEGDSEVFANEGVLGTLVSLQSQIYDGKCGETSGYSSLRREVKRLVGYLNRVLVQMLIYRVQSITEEDTDFVELYSLSILPQIAACNPDVYYDLVDYTIEQNVTPETQSDVIRSLQSVYSCLHITCADIGAYEGSVVPQCNDLTTDYPSIAGYQPQNDVSKFAAMDRDIRQIRWMMKFGAFHAARDFYEHGWNGIISFGQIARNAFLSMNEIKMSDDFEAIAAYYGGDEGDNFASLIEQVFSGIAPFDVGTTTTQQRAAMIDGFLKGPLIYLAVTGVIEEALYNCDEGDSANLRKHWDEAVAFLVGSTEGESEGGAISMPGDSLFGLADSLCANFGTCDPNKDMALVNTRLMENFNNALQPLASGQCEQINTIYKQSIRPDLLVAMIQGTLLSYIHWSKNGIDESGYVYPFSRILLPIFSSGMTGDKSVLTDLDRVTDFTRTRMVPVSSDVGALFGYFTTVLQSFQFVCQNAGGIREVDNGLIQQVCPAGTPVEAPPQAPSLPTPQPPAPTLAPTTRYSPPTRAPAGVPKVAAPDHPEGIAWGRYQFVAEDWAENDARFALDIKDMWTATSTDLARQAYEVGGSVPGGLSGRPEITTIASMSTQSGSVMANDILYNFYMYAIYDDKDFDAANLDGADPWPYGHEVVDLALDSTHGDSSKLAAEAATVMNVYMMIIHQMYEAGRVCKTGSSDAAKYIDSAVGLWIGEDQGEGIFDSGYSMYSVGQEAFKLYGNDMGESPANTALMQTFALAQQTALGCNSVDDTSYKRLRHEIDRVIHDLSVPLLQMFLYYLSVQDTNYVELFSLAFIPQIISCNIDEFGDLSNGLFQADVLDQTDAKKLNLLENLAGGLSCLRYTCDDLGNVDKAGESLQIIVRDICEDMTNDFGLGYLASYQVSTDETQNREINEVARLDLDLLQIEILMKAKAVSNAEEIYIYGRNSRETDPYQLKSLKQLSEDPVRKKAGVLYDEYVNLYGENFGGSFVEEVFQNNRYEGASRLEKSQAVVRTIQTTVSYANIVGRLREAIDVCKSGTPPGFDKVLVDEAAALFVGSIEGSKSGGSSTNSGTMLMALGKEVCESFGTCATQGDSTANEFIMFAFSDMKEWFEQKECDSAEKILDESLMTMLPVNMIQGTIRFAYQTERGVVDGVRTAADAVGQSIIPLVNAVNTTAADILIESLGYDPTEDLRAGDVIDAIASSLRGLNVDCNAIGTYIDTGASTCRVPEDSGMPPVPDTPVDLGDGKYTSTTYIQDRADISKDVQQIREALKIDKKALATEIYNDGENSPIYNDEGIEIGTRSLKKFSTEASEKMKFNPLYQATVYALRDASGNYLGAPASQYADSVVVESFEKGGELAADAAVALNLWMEATNELFQMLENCKRQLLKDKDGIHSIDEAAAYWLGDAQTDSQAENGHLLYAFAEQMAAEFGTVGGNGQATSNTNLLQLFQAAKLELSYPDACSEDVITVRRTRHLVNQAISQMLIPMVQALIHSIITSDKERVRVYAHAVVPQVVTCSPTTFDYLKEKLISGSYSATEEDSIVLALQSVYGCLGITCQDIGFHRSSELDIDCDDDEEIAALSGYRTRTDAGEFSQLDLDIQELDILMAMEAYEAAEELYRFGRHARARLGDDRISLSLESVATNTGRSEVPEFVAFEQFYKNDANYADTIMKKTFDGSEPTMTATHRRYVAVGTAQYLIMYMGALQAMQESIQACKRDSKDLGASEYWDRAAAYIIGHMEGSENSGSEEGLLIWGLAKQVCAEWGTCAADGEDNAAANERIRSLLYTGRGALTSGRTDACKGLENAATELTYALRVPLIQGAISAVVKISESSGTEKERQHAKAHALANAIAPLIGVKNRNAADTIQINLDFADSPLTSGLTPVVDAFTKNINILRVDCADIGKSSTVDTCTGQVSSNGPKPIVFAIIALFVLGTLGIGFMAYRKRRNNKTKDEPVFVPNDKGELSHDEVIGNGSSSRSDAQDIMHNDADAAADDDFEHAELPETV